MSGSSNRAPARLQFDDGSRIMQEAAEPSERQAVVPSPRGSDVSIHDYYEVNRLAKEVVETLQLTSTNNKRRRNKDDGFLCRIALQFPDELLVDSAQVSWAIEKRIAELVPSAGSIQDDTSEKGVENILSVVPPPLVFVLGDTTFGSCCPDEVAAEHLEADLLIHYGHACLSPTLSLPVLYSFGVTCINVEKCVDQVMKQIQKDECLGGTLVVLYELRYHHAIKELESRFSSQCNGKVFVGRLPEQKFQGNFISLESKQKAQGSCCAANDHTCTAKNTLETGEGSEPGTDPGNSVELYRTEEKVNMATSMSVGGLEFTIALNLEDCSVLFIGDQEEAQSRQYVNSMLRFLSCSPGPARYWTYSPSTEQLSTCLPIRIQRQLNRRFFLVQKARDASVFGILVGTMSQRHFRTVVSNIRTRIEQEDRACYTFAVGKINVAKLANFAEIECYVLVACVENSLLDDERDMHVPVITPLELDMALDGGASWGAQPYSLDYNEYLSLLPEQAKTETTNAEVDEGYSSDEPYFSLVTGQYETRSKLGGKGQEEIDLKALPGKGQLTAYHSEAAEFLKKREYQGLQANIGQNEVHAAVKGHVGIASDYGDR